jgi:hypothetical protein
MLSVLCWIFTKMRNVRMKVSERNKKHFGSLYTWHILLQFVLIEWKGVNTYSWTVVTIFVWTYSYNELFMRSLLLCAFPPISFVMSICPCISAQLPLNIFSWNLILGTCMKICQEKPDLVKIGQKYWAVDLINTHQIDLKINMHFLVSIHFIKLYGGCCYGHWNVWE